MPATIRIDYMRNTRWTYEEAAVYAGWSVGHVRRLVSKRLIHKAAQRGRFKIDAESVMYYVKTGMAQPVDRNGMVARAS